MKKSTASLRGALAWTTVAAAALVLAIGPAVSADKLVIFRNGKALRVKGVETADEWTHLDLGGGNTIGVLSAQIVAIEDSSGKTGNRAASLPNQATVGGRGGGGASGGRGRDVGSRTYGRSLVGIEPQEEPEQEESLDGAENRGVAGRGIRHGDNRRPRPGISGVQQQQQQQQQLNSFGGKRNSNRTRGLSARSSFRSSDAPLEDPETEQLREEEGDE